MIDFDPVAGGELAPGMSSRFIYDAPVGLVAAGPLMLHSGDGAVYIMQYSDQFRIQHRKSCNHSMVLRVGEYFSGTFVRKPDK